MTTRFIQDSTANSWYLVDAQDRILGRLASEMVKILRGKHKASFSPHQDNGDFLIVLNADKVRVTGKKEEQKIYHRFSTRPGHKKEITFRELAEKKPGEALRIAVKGMLPKNSMGAKLLKKMKVYIGSEHPHQAQNPSPLGFDEKGHLLLPAVDTKVPDAKAKKTAPVKETAGTDDKTVEAQAKPAETKDSGTDSVPAKAHDGETGKEQ